MYLGIPADFDILVPRIDSRTHGIDRRTAGIPIAAGIRAGITFYPVCVIIAVETHRFSDCRTLRIGIERVVGRHPRNEWIDTVRLVVIKFQGGMCFRDARRAGLVMIIYIYCRLVLIVPILLNL